MINTLYKARKSLQVPVLSVVIVSRNRPEKLFHSLQTLSQSSLTKFEVVVVDQSDDTQSASQFQGFTKKFMRFSHVYSQQKGKSRGLNQALKLIQAPLVAFTDDDCIADKEWLTSIYKTFVDHPSISGVFGKTIAYQPKKHKGFFCPSLFENKNPKPHVINMPNKHSEWIGIGNNMAFRKKVFEEIGGFKEWLGPGSVGSNSEDADIAVRALIAGKKLFYNPDAVIYHDRWLTLNESNMQDFSYICGESACYGYLALTGSTFAKKILKNDLHKVFFSDTRLILFLLIHLRHQAFTLSFWWVTKMLARIRGSMVALSAFLFIDVLRQ